MKTTPALHCLILLPLLVMPSLGSSYRVPAKPASAAVADVNQDGHLDLVIACDSDSIQVLLNDGHGKFQLGQSLQIHYFGKTLKVALFNQDSLPDFVTQYIDGTGIYLVVYVDSSGVFVLHSKTKVEDDIDFIEVGDLDRKNGPDVVGLSNMPRSMCILYNDGAGNLLPPSYFSFGLPPLCPTIGDVHADGRPDILIGGQHFLLFSNTDAGFEIDTIDTGPTAIQQSMIRDFDNDGKVEIVAKDPGILGSKVRLFTFRLDEAGEYRMIDTSQWLNEAAGWFNPVDLNNDGLLDLTYNASFTYPNSEYEMYHTYILFNRGDGTFQDQVNYSTGACSYNSITADLDGNGWKDIVTLNYDYLMVPPDTGSIHVLFNQDGTFQEDPVTTVVEESTGPRVFSLVQNFPNPFNPSTTIRYAIPVRAHVRLSVFDLLGREVITLVDEERAAGTYTARLDGSPLSSGVYFYRLDAGSFSKTKKLALLK